MMGSFNRKFKIKFVLNKLKKLTIVMPRSL